MVEVTIDYLGDLRCSAQHGPSGNTLITDAPVDNHGKGEAFSPTDLVATAVGACMATVVGIVAKRKEIAVEGMKVHVRKLMTSSGVRRIQRLEVDIEMPLPGDSPERMLFENAAMTCPVKQSIHPDIELAIQWKWL